MRHICLTIIAACALCTTATWAAPARPSLQDALAKARSLPPWWNTITVHFDTSKPWKEGHQEARNLLHQGGDKAREAVKLTYIYRQKGDMGAAGDFPTNLMLAGETAWAMLEYTRCLQGGGQQATFAYIDLASCYRYYGENAKALQVLNAGLSDLPKAPWDVVSRANLYDAIGDTYAAMGDTANAKRSYERAIALYPTSQQPTGRHLLPRYAAKTQTKLSLLAQQGIQGGQLKDGAYSGTSLGYAGDVNVTVTVKSGKVATIGVKHQEKIEQGAADVIPKRIIAQQSLRVDAITGATVTSQAVVDGTYQALKKAGLQ